MMVVRASCEGLRVMLVVLGAYQFVAFGQPFLAVCDELVVVAVGHAHVSVVVPRNESLVTHGPKLCSRHNEIAEVILFACLVDGLQDAQHHVVKVVEIVFCHKSLVSVVVAKILIFHHKPLVFLHNYTIIPRKIKRHAFIVGKVSRCKNIKIPLAFRQGG